MKRIIMMQAIPKTHRLHAGEQEIIDAMNQWIEAINKYELQRDKEWVKTTRENYERKPASLANAQKDLLLLMLHHEFEANRKIVAIMTDVNSAEHKDFLRMLKGKYQGPGKFNATQ